MDHEHYEAALARCDALPFDLKVKAYSYVGTTHDLAPLSDFEKPFAAQITEQARALPRVWYHGGLAGRRPDDMLLPASITRANPRSHEGERRLQEWVYVTLDTRVALKFVRMNEKKGNESRIYAVEPEGDLGPDPQGLRIGLLLLMDRARIAGQAEADRIMSRLWDTSETTHQSAEDYQGQVDQLLSRFRCDRAKVRAVYEVARDGPIVPQGAMPMAERMRHLVAQKNHRRMAQNGRR